MTGAAAVLASLERRSFRAVAQTPSQAVSPLSDLQKTTARHPELDFMLTDQAGVTMPLGRFRGKPVLAHFWATWCGPCLRELPELDRFYAAHNAALTMLPIAVASGQAQKIETFYKAHGIKALPVYTAEAGAVQKAYGEKELSLPATLLLDRDGKLNGEIEGSIAWSSPDAAAVLSSLAKEG